IAEGAKGKPAEAAAAKAEAAPVVEIRISEDGNAVVVEKEPKEGATAEAVEVIIQNDAGKTVRTIRSPQAYRAAARFHIDPAAIDPETRQAIEKLLAGLKEEVKRLQDEGKKDEAEKKLQSLRALAQLLNPGPQWSAVAMQPGGANVAFRTLDNENAIAEL